MDKENPQGTGVKAKRLGLKAAGLGVLNTVRENAAFLERNAQEKPKEKPKEKVEPHVAERIAWIKKRWPRESNDDYDRRVKQALGAQFVKECKKAKEDHISSSVLRALIEAGADPNHKDEYELTALYYASKAGASRVCNELLLAGCDTGHRKAVCVQPRPCTLGVGRADAPLSPPFALVPSPPPSPQVRRPLARVRRRLARGPRRGLREQRARANGEGRAQDAQAPGADPAEAEAAQARREGRLARPRDVP